MRKWFAPRSFMPAAVSSSRAMQLLDVLLVRPRSMAVAVARALRVGVGVLM